MIGGKRGVRSRHIGSHPEGWARYDTVQKHTREYTLQRRVAPGPSFRMGKTAAAFLLVLSALPPVRLFAQGDLDRLALRFASMTAVTGLEQAMVDSLRALFPGSTRDHVGNVTLTLGQGSPKRLFTCPLDEVGYVVGNILPDGFLLLRRVGGGGAGRTASPLFDQQLEGHRVSVFGARGAVPGVVAVKSTHLTRGRGAPGTPDPVFTVDNAYVDGGATAALPARYADTAVETVALADADRLVREILQWMEGR